MRLRLGFTGILAFVFLSLPQFAQAGEVLADSDGGVLATSLRIAARDGRIKEVGRLLKRGADVNATGEYGETALLNACRSNHIKVAFMLLAAGADTDARDDRDDTPLMKAAMNCSSRISGALISRDSNVNLTNYDGRSALIYAAMNGCVQVIQQLLSIKGIDVNIKDDSGHTALDYALEESQIEVGGPYTTIALALRAVGGKTAAFYIVPRSRTGPRLVNPALVLP
ncbi:MAG TPA: ankyrin repeat domain-containing protein [Bdellovibrionota bacterium]|nr:ankyrin repeat domain-containing protein [Bdellovibrionota bacterium]